MYRQSMCPSTRGLFCAGDLNRNAWAEAPGRGIVPQLHRHCVPSTGQAGPGAGALREVPCVPDRAAYNNVACVLLKLGKRKRALELYAKCLAVLIAPLGEQHPNVVTTYTNIATVAHQLGELDRALEFVRKVPLHQGRDSRGEAPRRGDFVQQSFTHVSRPRRAEASAGAV